MKNCNILTNELQLKFPLQHKTVLELTPRSDLSFENAAANLRKREKKNSES